MSGLIRGAAINPARLIRRRDRGERPVCASGASTKTSTLFNPAVQSRPERARRFPSVCRRGAADGVTIRQEIGSYRVRYRTVPGLGGSRPLAKISRVAHRARSSTAAKPAAEARVRTRRNRPNRRGTRRPIWICLQALESPDFAEEESLDFASPRFGFPSSRFGFPFPRLRKSFP